MRIKHIFLRLVLSWKSNENKFGLASHFEIPFTWLPTLLPDCQPEKSYQIFCCKISLPRTIKQYKRYQSFLIHFNVRVNLVEAWSCRGWEKPSTMEIASRSQWQIPETELTSISLAQALHLLSSGKNYSLYNKSTKNVLFRVGYMLTHIRFG